MPSATTPTSMREQQQQQQQSDDDSCIMSEEEEDYEEEEEEEEDYTNPPKDIEVLWNFICCEARSVSVWCVLASLLRLCLNILIKLAKNASSGSNTTTTTGVGNFLWMELCGIVSVLASGILGIFPAKVAQSLAPGFPFGWSVLLYWVSNTFYGPIPNLPVRICEMIMGRMTLREFLICFPVHVSCTLSTIKAFSYFCNISITTEEFAIDPIVYSSANPWLSDLFRETVANTAFVVGLLVIPEILKLNNIPQWITMFVMYPIYSFSVDAEGRGSVFSPNILYSLIAVARDRDHYQEQHDAATMPSTISFQFAHMIGSLIGGLLAGKIMCKYFPDHS